MAKETRGRSQTKLGYNELKGDLRQGSWQRVYVLSGEELFLIEKLVEALGECLIQPGSEALDRVVLQAGNRSGRLEPDRVRTEVMTPPFLSRCKLVIVRQSGWFALAGNNRTTADPADGDEGEADAAGNGTSAAKDRQAELVTLFAQLPSSACLVFIETKVDRRLKSLIGAIEQAGVLAEFAKQPPRTLQRWIEAEGKRRDLSIEPLAAESLIDRCDSSMQVIDQEMTKLFLYCRSAGVAHVTRDLIDAISLPDLHGSIFDMTDALASGRTGRALELVDILIGQKQPVQLIQFMLARHLRQLICAAELQQPARITASLKVPPFVAGRLARQAARLSPELLETLYGACFHMDIQMKSGRISDRLALETLLVESATTLAAARRH